MQIRGSIPIFWAEINTLRYKPDVQIMDLQDTVRYSGIYTICKHNNSGYQLDAARLHFEEQVSLYGQMSLVNLVNHKGHEKPVKDAFESRLAEVSTFKQMSSLTEAVDSDL